MQVIHTSPNPITEINQDGLFDDCLFFAEHEYSMGNIAATYTLELDADKVCDGSALDETGDAEIKAIAELMRIYDEISRDEAVELLSDEADAYSLLSDRLAAEALADLCWDIQRLQGRLARELGFDAFLSRDEQGPVYIVAMTGRLAELTLQK